MKIDQIKLLGQIPLEANEFYNIPPAPEDGSGWNIFSWTDERPPWPDTCWIEMISADLQWKIFQLAERNHVLMGAKRIGREGIPLRFDDIGLQPVNPDVTSVGSDYTAAVINEKWLDAPIEAELFMVEGPTKPLYAVQFWEKRLAVKFYPNGAKFYAKIVTRSPTD